MNGPIAGATQLTYQPPTLTLPAGSQDCYQDFIYTAKITSECGTESCSATIRLYNDDAPNGLLEMDPVEPLPFCPGEDATLRYTPACAGEPERWTWHISTDGVTFSPITTAGDQNPLYNTNRLYQDTWYRIEKQNGLCAIDQIDFFIPVKAPLSITNFTANHAPICNPTSVAMTVDFVPAILPPSTCDYTLTWYRDGQVIHTSTATSGPQSYTYTPTTSSEIEGNYYVIISSNCCNESVKSSVIQVDPPCEVAILGPCFRCKTENVTLTGVVINPIAGATCTYQWYDENGAIAGATGLTLQVGPSQAGPFTFEVTCVVPGATCIKSTNFDLRQCGDNPFLLTAVEEIEFFKTKVYPNPTTGRIKVEFDQAVEPEMVMVITDVNGRVLQKQSLIIGDHQQTIDLLDHPAGIYFVKIMKEGIPVWIEKVMKI